MPFTVFSLRVRRSMDAGSRPFCFAEATSLAFSAMSLVLLSRRAVAMFSSAWFLALVSACATRREAARALPDGFHVVLDVSMLLVS
jgi:hypothetical protein